MQYQKEVRKQIAKGLLVLGGVIVIGWVEIPGFSERQRLAILSGSILLLAIPLFLSIAAVIIGRYSSESLIFGYKSTDDGLSFKQAYLQNTLEQTSANVLPLIALGLVVPGVYLKVCIIQAASFCIGRVMYFLGYKRDPMERFTGFVVGWYSAAIAYLVAAYFVVITIN